MMLQQGAARPAPNRPARVGSTGSTPTAAPAGPRRVPSGAYERPPLPVGHPASQPTRQAQPQNAGGAARAGSAPHCTGGRAAAPGGQPPPQHAQPEQQQLLQPLTWPRQPLIPEQYWRPGDVTRWDQMWVPAIGDASLSTMPVQPNCSQINDFILIGNMLCASDLERLRAAGATHVLTLTKRVLPQDVRSALNCLQVIVHDTPQTPVSQHFEEASNHILHAKKNGGRIFVHCRAGVSRGSCFVIAYLIQHERMTLQHAYELVKSRRAIAHPNKGFLEQLKKLEVTVHGRQVSDIRFESLPFTLWERAEHIGLNDPIPSLALCQEAERRAAEEYRRQHGQRNPYMTMDAGLGGKMELHVVELFSVLDFEWLDAVLVDVLYTHRPADGNYVSRKHLRQPSNASQQSTQQQQQQQPA